MLTSIDKIDISNCESDLLKEYISFKKDNPDYILFFQIGEFYETFFEDAQIFSRIADISLGHRKFKTVGEVVQAGVPVSNSNFYIKKLLGENLKICVAVQFKQDDKIFRKIVRKYTKGTLLENEFLDSQEYNYILAVYLYNNICYLSYADVSTGQFYKTQSKKENIIEEIEKISPNELLISINQKEDFKDIILQFNTTFLKDDYFDHNNIENTILSYCKENQIDFFAQLEKVQLYNIESYMTMDQITRMNLELTRTRRFLKKKGSLLWFLNYTNTPMGARLLKKYLSEPLLNTDTIKKRLEAVEELILKNELNFFEDILKSFTDLSRICARISNSTIFPKDLFLLVKNSRSLCDLCNLCSKFNSDILKVDEKKLNKTFKLVETIKSAIKEDSSNELMSGNIINDGYNSELDYFRTNLKKIYSKIRKYENQQKKSLNLDKLKIDYSSILGYYIEIPNYKQNCIPSDYLKKHELTHCSRYTTATLCELESEIYNLKYKINKLEYELYCEVRAMASEFVEIIRDLANEIAKIDVIYSLAKCALINNLVKPDFNLDGIYIQGGFHPSLIKLKNEVIKNDTILNNGSMAIITGANMSGKSTYLKHNAIICLLSQIGSFVPAKNASLTIVDKIFIRQSSTDDIISNNSSFMVEMNDLKFILDNATSSSFILLDEPAKSTNEKEGGAIAKAFCEYLLKYFNSKIMLVTHNLDLTKLESEYQSKVTNYVMGNQDVCCNEIINRKIKKGIISSSLAINTAQLAQLPSEIIENAKRYTML